MRLTANRSSRMSRPRRSVLLVSHAMIVVALVVSAAARGDDSAIPDQRAPAAMTSQATRAFTWPAPEIDPPFDVLHYDLDLRFDLAVGGIEGTATVRARWGSAAGSELRLDLRDLAVRGVRSATGAPLAFAQDAAGVSITLAPSPVRGDTVQVAIDYGGRPTSGF